MKAGTAGLELGFNPYLYDAGILLRDARDDIKQVMIEVTIFYDEIVQYVERSTSDPS